MNESLRAQEVSSFIEAGGGLCSEKAEGSALNRVVGIYTYQNLHLISSQLIQRPALHRGCKTQGVLLFHEYDSAPYALFAPILIYYTLLYNT